MVEWKKLGDVCESIKGRSLSKKDIGLGTLPIILYGELYTTYGDYITTIKNTTSLEKAKEATILQYTDLILPVSSTTKEAQIGKTSVIKTRETVSLGSDAIILRIKNKNRVDPCFLMYFLNSGFFEKDKMSCVIGTTIMHLSPSKLIQKKIPIPSIQEQQHIVETLDTFTSAIDNLKEQIAQRRKQFEYYRDHLLDLEGKPGVEMNTLGELSYKISSGRNKNKEDQGQYPVFGSTGIIAYTNSYLFDKPLILVARVGANAGYVYMINEKCDVTDNTLIVETKEDNNRKFIYYYLVYMNINQFAKGGGQPLITGGLLKDLLIPLPPLREQQRIVSILDTFEASIHNLEAQLEQRQKQYEYYRNKLLTFEK